MPIMVHHNSLTYTWKSWWSLKWRALSWHFKSGILFSCVSIYILIKRGRIRGSTGDHFCKTGTTLSREREREKRGILNEVKSWGGMVIILSSLSATNHWLEKSSSPLTLFTYFFNMQSNCRDLEKLPQALSHLYYFCLHEAMFTSTVWYVLSVWALFF